MTNIFKSIKLPPSWVIIGSVLVLIFICFQLPGCFTSKKRNRPPDLVEHKQDFNNQVKKFDEQKESTYENVIQGIYYTSELQKVVGFDANLDDEFRNIYERWGTVESEIDDLYFEYDKLRNRATTLFNAMKNQVNNLQDADTQRKLLTAVAQLEKEYGKNLRNAEIAIGDLRQLRIDALDNIRALEVAVAIGQIADINTGLTSLKNKAQNIMHDLNKMIAESKELFETKLENGLKTQPEG